MIDDLMKNIVDLGYKVTVMRQSMQSKEPHYIVRVERDARGFHTSFHGCSIEEGLSASWLIIEAREKGIRP